MIDFELACNISLQHIKTAKYVYNADLRLPFYLSSIQCLRASELELYQSGGLSETCLPTDSLYLSVSELDLCQSWGLSETYLATNSLCLPVSELDLCQSWGLSETYLPSDSLYLPV